MCNGKIWKNPSYNIDIFHNFYKLWDAESLGGQNLMKFALPMLLASALTALHAAPAKAPATKKVAAGKKTAPIDHYWDAESWEPGSSSAFWRDGAKERTTGKTTTRVPRPSSLFPNRQTEK